MADITTVGGIDYHDPITASNNGWAEPSATVPGYICGLCGVPVAKRDWHSAWHNETHYWIVRRYQLDKEKK